jgi:tRNA (guanine-N7-)-methyltransferase
MSKSKGPQKRSRQDVEPITADGEMPQKRFYRSRAHCNPLSFNENFDYPVRPDLFDWTEDHYPNHPLLKSDDEKHVISSFHNASIVRPNVLDVGCGFGGLTMALSPLLPNHTILGLEIRTKVTEYVRLRILAHRKEHPDQYQNCSVMRTNAMKYLVHYFPKGSLDKIFFCFPDPHFKKKNHPRRIISERLLSEYAYLLKAGGKLYCITDVKDLHDWHVEKCSAHPLLVGCSKKEMEEDPCVELMRTETEEGKKVEREGRFGHDKYYMVYKRVDESEESACLGSVTAENFFQTGQFGVEMFGNEKKS